jgi:hypothetical protein
MSGGGGGGRSLAVLTVKSHRNLFEVGHACYIVSLLISPAAVESQRKLDGTDQQCLRWPGWRWQKYVIRSLLLSSIWNTAEP